MPCATIHLLTAGRVLEAWQRRPADAPFPVDDPGTAEAFLHGNLAPDMGFVPGTDRLVSELAHYHSPADLSRVLLDSATDPREEAFAWGWAAHVLADVELHPLVGRAVGERLYGDRERRVDALEDVTTHVSLEVGLDVVFLLRNPSAPLPPSRPHFDARGLRHLTDALEATYGVGWDPDLLLRNHRRAVRLTLLWPRALRVLAAGRPLAAGGARGGLLRGPASGLLALLRMGAGKRSAMRGFLAPERPPDWAIARMEEGVRSFPERFQELVRGGLRGLENRNLETGGPAGPGLGHPASDEVARKLAALAPGEGSPVSGEGGA
jgi:hypothetical protein